MSSHSEPMEQNDFQDGGVEKNSNVLFSKESLENGPFKENRVIRKAKRTLKKSPSKDDGVVNNVGLHNNHLRAPGPLSKNSRKSRNGYGRGQPKKGEKLIFFKEASQFLSALRRHLFAKCNSGLNPVAEVRLC